MSLTEAMVASEVATGAEQSHQLDGKFQPERSTEKLLAEHLNSARSALLKQEGKMARSRGMLTLRSNRVKTAPVRQTYRTHVSSAQPYLFSGSVFQSSPRVEMPSQATLLPGNSDYWRPLRRLPIAKANREREGTEFRLYYEPLSPKFELAPVSLGDEKVLVSDVLPERIQRFENGVFSSQSKQLQPALSRARSASNLHSSVTFYDNDQRGTYFVLDQNGISVRRPFRPTTRVQVGRNGQPIRGDAQLRDMLGAAALLSNETAAFKDSLKSHQANEEKKLREKLSWKDELLHPTGKLFDLDTLDQKKEAQKAKEALESTRMASETVPNEPPLDLEAAGNVIKKNDRLLFPLAHAQGFPLVNRTPEAFVSLIRKPQGEARLSRQKSALALRTVKSACVSDSYGRPSSFETLSRPTSRYLRPQVDSLPIPSLKLSDEQWHIFSARPSPRVDESQEPRSEPAHRKESVTLYKNAPDASIPAYREMVLMDETVRITPFGFQPNSRVPTGRRTRLSSKSALSGSLAPQSRLRSATASFAGDPVSTSSTSEYLSFVQGYSLVGIRRTLSARPPPRYSPANTTPPLIAQPKANATVKSTTVKKQVQPSAELIAMVTSVKHVRTGKEVMVPQTGPESVITDSASTLAMASENGHQNLANAAESPEQVNVDITANEPSGGTLENSDKVQIPVVEDNDYTPAPPVTARVDLGVQEPLPSKLEQISPRASSPPVPDVQRSVAEKVVEPLLPRKTSSTEVHVGEDGVLRIDLSIPVVDYDREFDLSAGERREN